MVSTFIVGLTLGLVGKYLVLGNSSSNFVVPVFLGILGAFIAHFLGGSTGWYRSDDPIGFVATSAGSILLLAIYGVLIHRNKKVSY
ncbi:MAG TPA: GlsB/YeaQ/YmgE family stress response membrane protein [Bacteriovoracaceae bacterium]|nr:GlsB/YeaQ/YmgE family stress response membrane protein [Bacteriovoracaceae bacterium]